MVPPRGFRQAGPQLPHLNMGRKMTISLISPKMPWESQRPEVPTWTSCLSAETCRLPG